MLNSKKEKLYVILFFTALTVILTWPTAWHFFSSVPSSGSDTMQVIGVAGDKANLIADQGFFKGTFELIKRSEFNITTIYAYFQLIFGRVAGYNLLFFISFILSGFGAYLLALYFIHPAPKKDSPHDNTSKVDFWCGASKPAALLAGIIFAFAPFHIHNAMSTNAGTMHQEWLPFFVLYLFKFFENLKFRNFVLSGLFLFLIGFTEHQLLAFTVVFISFFLVYKLITEPKLFLRGKFWLYAGTSVIVLSVLFFVMFRSLFTIAGSGNNYLDAGLKSAVKYSNDALSIFVPPNFHTFWPNAFSHLRNQFERNFDSSFSDYAGYSVMLLSLIAILGIRPLKRGRIPVKGIWFWLAVTIGFYALSLGPYLHYKGVLDPPIKMPYWLIYQYLPFYKNIRTVGRLFVFSTLGFSVLAAWGMAFINFKFSIFNFQKKNGDIKNDSPDKNETINCELNKRSKILYFFIGLIIILEFLAVPLKTDSLLHSSFYEKLGQDKEKYSVLEVPGSTDYDFASRDLVWKSIHQKATINGFDFARVNKEGYMFQRGTPIIRTLLYDIPGGDNGNDRDIVKNSYYNISSEILNYYNIRWVILDKTALKGDPAKGDSDLSYSAKAYVASVIKCADIYEDEYLYACKIDQSDSPDHMFLAMDYSNDRWVGKSDNKNGLQRWAENGAGMKIVNMTGNEQKSRLNFNLKISKPLRLKVFLNGEEIFNQYITAIGQKQDINADLPNIKPGENEMIFGVYGADNSEIRSDKKSDTAVIYQVEVE